MLTPILHALLFCLITMSAIGQVKKPTHSKSIIKPATQKQVPFKLKTMLGKNINGGAVTVNEGLQLLKFPLRVLDDKNISYPIYSYNLMYKRKGIIEDENTGKKQVSYTSIGDRFTTTPLPSTWEEKIRETLKSGEELYFFDIIIKDKMGRKSFAPDLKIEIQ